jgi:hypothetical protein
MEHFMRWLEMRTRHVPRAGINVKKPWRGWFWIYLKGQIDTTAAIQDRSSTRVPDESRVWSCLS